DPDRAVAAMVGRELGGFTRRSDQGARPDASADPALTVRELSGRRHHGVSFDLPPGEILGVAGLPDSGRVELLHNILGGDPGTGGSVELRGRPYERRNRISSVERRLAFVPGERGGQGLLTTMSVG